MALRVCVYVPNRSLPLSLWFTGLTCDELSAKVLQTYERNGKIGERRGKKWSPFYDSAPLARVIKNLSYIYLSYIYLSFKSVLIPSISLEGSGLRHERRIVMVSLSVQCVSTSCWKSALNMKYLGTAPWKCGSFGFLCFKTRGLANCFTVLIELASPSLLSSSSCSTFPSFETVETLAVSSSLSSAFLTRGYCVAIHELLGWWGSCHSLTHYGVSNFENSDWFCRSRAYITGTNMQA